MQHLPLQTTDIATTITPTSTSPSQRPGRPCDACRRRKSRCVLDTQDATSCVMCTFHNRNCTFLEDAAPRKRRARSFSENEEVQRSKHIKEGKRRPSENSNHTASVIGDYANLQGASLLKQTLGLQNHRYARFLGLTDGHDQTLLNLRPFNNTRAEHDAHVGTFRKVASNCFFHQFPDLSPNSDEPDFTDVDEVEQTVAPYGQALIRLYFRIVHPSFPILHKKVYLEKYARSHREFTPPLLAAVYILSLNWWSYSSELAAHPKPDVAMLEKLACRTLHELSNRAKLSTVQAGILLLQQPSLGSWALTCMITGMAQDLGLHLDCSHWRIPIWERGLRKRIAWAVYMQSKWSALMYGRPSHIHNSNWQVTSVTSNDFPESAADEDDEEGSTEVEKGRSIFSAMIALSKMLSEILEDLCSLKFESDMSSHNQLEVMLSHIKPLQLRLKSWYAQMPATLHFDAPSKVGKLNSVGHLHLAYFAVEITMHRRIISSLSHDTDPYLIEVCRSAAKSRLKAAMEFFNALKPEHLQSFWYFASAYNLGVLGTFAGLCLTTGMNRNEIIFYHQQLQEYKWTLRVRSKGHEFVEQANTILLSTVQPLLRPLDDLFNGEIQFSMLEVENEQVMEERYLQPIDQLFDAMGNDYMFSAITT